MCREIVDDYIRRRNYNGARAMARALYHAAEGNGGYQGRALMYLLETRVKQGDFAGLDKLAAQAVRLLVASKFKASACRVLRLYAQGLLMLGRIDEARTALLKAVALEDHIPRRSPRDESLYNRACLEDRTWLGRCELEAFDLARASEYCDAAFEYLPGNTDKWNEGELKLLKALVTLPTSHTQAEEFYNEAYAIFANVADPIDYDRARAMDDWGRATNDADLVRKAITIYNQLPNSSLARRADDWLAERGVEQPFVPARRDYSDAELVEFTCGVKSEIPIRVEGMLHTRALFLEAANLGHHDTKRTKLILGESGTGKDTVARVMHNAGPRANKPFVAVNCGALVGEIFLSELFGHVKGAFTGAHEDRKGLLHKANGGTLLLDEIHRLSKTNQGALLRMLEDKIYSPVGGRDEISIDVQVISATNRDIYALAEQGEFADDLLRRISKTVVTTTPLRERPEEIAVLANHIVAYHARQSGWDQCHLSDEAHALLASYDWPGNIRTLEAILYRAVVAVENRVIGVDALHFAAEKNQTSFRKARPVSRVEEDEVDSIYHELRTVIDTDSILELSANLQDMTNTIRNHVLLAIKRRIPSDTHGAKFAKMKLGTYRDALEKAQEQLETAKADVKSIIDDLF